MTLVSPLMPVPHCWANLWILFINSGECYFSVLGMQDWSFLRYGSQSIYQAVEI